MIVLLLMKEETYHGYKEPLRSFLGGYGYIGVLSQDENGEKLQCHICGEYYSRLNNHVRMAHKIKVDEYKQRVGLSKGTALVGDKIREKQIEVAKKNYPKVRDRLHAGAREKRAERGGGGKPESMERKNKKGTCPDQLLARIVAVTKDLGRVPTKKEYQEHQDGGFLLAIKRTFGSWEEALSQIGMARSGKHKNYSELELLNFIILFYKINHRLPSYSDSRRGLIPPTSQYSKQFGSLSFAIEAIKEELENIDDYSVSNVKEL